MRGIAWLDVDNNLGFRTREFLEETDPRFLTNNNHYMVKAWHFDTDDFDVMHRMFSNMRDIRLNGSLVRDLARSIGFDLQRLKEGR